MKLMKRAGISIGVVVLSHILLVPNTMASKNAADLATGFVAGALTEGLLGSGQSAAQYVIPPQQSYTYPNPVTLPPPPTYAYATPPAYPYTTPPAYSYAPPPTPQNTQNQGYSFQMSLKQSYRDNRIKNITAKTTQLLPNLANAPALPIVNSYNYPITLERDLLNVHHNPYVAFSLLAFMDQDRSKQWVQVGNGAYIVPAGTQVWSNGLTPPDVAQHPSNPSLWIVNTLPSGAVLREPGPIILRLPANYQILYLTDYLGNSAQCVPTTNPTDFNIHDKVGFCMEIPTQALLQNLNLAG